MGFGEIDTIGSNLVRPVFRLRLVLDKSCSKT